MTDRFEGIGDKEIAKGNNQSVNLEPGSQSISLVVTDNVGAKITRSVNIIVAENNAPIVEITSPIANTPIAEGESVSFQASVQDDEDGMLEGEQLVWTTSLGDEQIGTGSQFDEVLANGQHKITLTATDSGGAVTKEHINICVAGPCNESIVLL